MCYVISLHSLSFFPPYCYLFFTLFGLLDRYSFKTDTAKGWSADWQGQTCTYWDRGTDHEQAWTFPHFLQYRYISPHGVFYQRVEILPYLVQPLGRPPALISTEIRAPGRDKGRHRSALTRGILPMLYLIQVGWWGRGGGVEGGRSPHINIPYFGYILSFKSLYLKKYKTNMQAHSHIPSQLHVI